jgi:hypothetical protein
MAGHYDPDLIDKAASNMLCEPTVYFQLAQRYAEEITALSPIALGTVAVPLILAGYDPAREALIGNIKGGVKKTQEIAMGLAKVAANYRGVEDANTPIASYKVDAKFTPPKSRGEPLNALELVGVTSLLPLAFPQAGAALAMALGPVNMATATTLSVTTGLEPLAIVSTILWAMFSPIDSETNRAIDGWVAVKRQLDNLGIDTALSPLDDGWKPDGADDSKTQFNQFMNTRFKPEVAEVATAANDTATALKTLLKDLHVLQMAAFLTAVSALVTIIAAWVAEAFPPAAPVCEAIKKITAAILNLNTAVGIAAVAAIIATVTGEIGKLGASISNLFPHNEINTGGGTTFQDITITWNSGQVR